MPGRQARTLTFCRAATERIVTRSQLIARLAKQRESLTHGDVEAAVKTMLEHLAGGERIEIRGFGCFERA